jgi:Transposase, Mutator family
MEFEINGLCGAAKHARSEARINHRNGYRARALETRLGTLETVLLASGSLILKVDQPLARIYFVETGVASLVTAFENRVTVGAATVGREGAVGVASLLLGGATALDRYHGSLGVP